MKGLYRYLSPFSPDQSGAVAVLYELGGIIVILDAGGCAGNICGFDEPRWGHKQSAVYSAGIRDLDAILGRDERTIDKVGGAVEAVGNANFIALIGTPVPAVVGTDLKALARMCEKKFGLSRRSWAPTSKPSPACARRSSASRPCPSRPTAWSTTTRVRNSRT